MPLSDEYRWGGGATEEEKKSSECTLKEKLVSHSVSTGFLRTMSAAEVSLSTGLVSLIGWGEAGLEPGAWHWGPGRNREKKRGGRQTENQMIKNKSSKASIPAVLALSPPTGHIREIILNRFREVSCFCFSDYLRILAGPSSKGLSSL